MKPWAAQLGGCVSETRVSSLGLAPGIAGRNVGWGAEPLTFLGGGEEEHPKSPWAVPGVVGGVGVGGGAQPARKAIF